MDVCGLMNVSLLFAVHYSVWMRYICSLSALWASVDILYNSGSRLKIILQRWEEPQMLSVRRAWQARERERGASRFTESQIPQILAHLSSAEQRCCSLPPLSSLSALYKTLTWETDRKKKKREDRRWSCTAQGLHCESCAAVWNLMNSVQVTLHLKIKTEK